MSTMSLSKTTVAISAIVLIAVSGGAGYWYGSSHPMNASGSGRGTAFAGGAGGFARGGAGGQGARGAFGGGQGVGMVTGEVKSVDQGSLTVQLRDGSSKLVITTSSTKATHMADATMDEIKQGEQVMVMGAANADGSVTAQTIQLRPDMPRMGMSSSTR